MTLESLSPSFLDTFSKEWFGDNPRSLGTPEQRIVTNYKVLLDYYNQTRMPVWMSVNPYVEGTNVVATGKVKYIDKIFYDFDHSDISVARDDAVKFCAVLANRHNIEPLLVYSGKKGYHVYVFLKDLISDMEQSDMRILYKDMADYFIDGAEYESLDTHVFDYKRVARVPYTMHQVTGNIVQPLTIDMKPIMLSPGFIQQFRHAGPANNVITEIRSRPEEKTVEDTVERKSQYAWTLRPCMQQVLVANSVHDPEHKLKVSAVAELLTEGASREEVIEFFRGMEGFSEDITGQQVDFIIFRQYRPFKCKTIESLGGCLKEKCGIYRNKIARDEVK
jgi:hypothetical protein